MDNKHQIQSIKFYALIPKPDGSAEAKGTFFGVGKMEGGKEIRSLYVVLTQAYVEIHQVTVDGESKRYIYKFDDISGRIEIVELR